MNEILSEEAVRDFQGCTRAKDFPGLCESHEALRAKVKDYEDRGMGKLDGHQVESLVAGVYVLRPCTSAGDSPLRSLEFFNHEGGVFLIVRVGPLAPVEKGGGG